MMIYIYICSQGFIKDKQCFIFLFIIFYIFSVLQYDYFSMYEIDIIKVLK